MEKAAIDAAAYGTHSMRRTKPTLIYRQTRNLRAVQLLLGHSKLESTVSYLGTEVDDALEIAEQTEVSSLQVGRGRRPRRSQTGRQRPYSEEVAESGRSIGLALQTLISATGKDKLASRCLTR